MKVLKIIALVAVIVAGIVALVFHLLKGITVPADQFFALLANGQTRQAYDMTHSSLRNITTYEQFEKIVADFRLDKFKEVSWHTRRLKNGRGVLAGTVTLEGDSSMPMSLAFDKEEGIWKISTFRVGENAGQ